MATLVGVSVPSFNRLFKEDLGTSPIAWLNDLRLDEAVEMLSNPICFLQIKEIAFCVGLFNQSHFTNAIKAKVGMTPTEFRAHQAEIHQSAPPDGQE